MEADILNREIISLHDNIYSDYNKIINIDKILKTKSLTDEEKLNLIRLRNKCLNGKAEQIETLLDKQLKENDVNNESNTVGIQSLDLGPEVEYELDEINEKMTEAVANQDDTKALKYFVVGEEAYLVNMERKLKNMDYRERRYYKPIIDGLYNRDELDNTEEILNEIKTEHNNVMDVEEAMGRSR